MILAMKEINQRRKDLKMTHNEWIAVWMLGNVRKRRKINKYVYQALRNVVKEGGVNILQNFENKFKEMRVEGCRKSAPSVMYTEDKLPETHYTRSELQEIETMYMGTESESRKRYQRQGSYRRQSFDRRQRSGSRDSRYGDSQRQSRYDGLRAGGSRPEKNQDRSCTPGSGSASTYNFPRCIGCRCKDCNQVKRDCEEIKKLINEKVNVTRVNEVSTEVPPAAINLCNQEVVMGEDMRINYMYTDFGRQMMILDIGAPVSLAGISWMSQYLQEFGLTIEQLKSVKCSQPFVFGPSKRYLSESLVELPVLITRLDGREDVLTIQTYLVDAEIPFLCGKQTLEGWNFKIDGRDKILEIESKTDGSRIRIKMIDTEGGHYAVILETRRKKDSSVLFLEDKKDKLCSFKAMRKVHEVNRHKQKEQPIAAYRNAGWMSPELVNVIH